MQTLDTHKVKSKDTETRTVEAGEGFRFLADGETLQHGDEYCDPHSYAWHLSKCVGRKTGIVNSTALIYRRSLNQEAAQ